MRKTRPEDFDPNYRKSSNGPRPEDINMAGIVPIKSKTIYEDNDRKSERKTVRISVRKTERLPYPLNDAPKDIVLNFLMIRF